MRISDWSSGVCSSDLPAFDRQSSESEAFRSGAVPHLVQRSQRLRERRSHPTRGDQVRCPLRSHLARGTPCTYARTSRCPPDSTLGRVESRHRLQPEPGCRAVRGAARLCRLSRMSVDRKSTRLNSSPNAHLVCRLPLETKNSHNTYT